MPAAVVTGGGGGLGRAIGRRLASDGYDVAVVDIARADADETSRQIIASGRRAVVYPVDVRDVEALDVAVRQADKDLGPVTALVNNAAIFPTGPFLDARPADFDEVVAVNQRAYFFAAQSAARLMVDRGGGSIVNLSSITQHGGWANLAGYVMTKGAAAALTRALATELGVDGIRVNCVAPGAFPTKGEDIHPDRAAYVRRIVDSQALKRRGRFEELAAAVSFLVGPDSSFVTGQTLNVDGGWIMA
jgi:NAD(P)-dependent dehydrogenase (short-subunit alcohol dehydrogenase family)